MNQCDGTICEITKKKILKLDFERKGRERWEDTKKRGSVILVSQ